MGTWLTYAKAGPGAHYFLDKGVPSMTKEDDDILRSWARLNVWLSEQTDEKEVKKMLDRELSGGRKTRPTVALRVYMRFAKMRREREMRELYSR